MRTTPRADDRHHRVLVYRHEPQLIEVAGGFLLDALAGGGAAVAIATEPHLTALDRWVRLCGTEVEDAAADKRYHRLAFAAASSWLDDDAGPAATFEGAAREALEQIPGGCGPIGVFCEVGAALWEGGLRTAALSVEAVTNSLLAMRPVSVLCAYPDGVVAGPGDLERACDEHTAVVEPPPFPAPHAHVATTTVSSAVLPPAPASCRQARQLVRAGFGGNGHTSNGNSKAVDIAELVMSELTGNAVRHAGSTFTTEVLSWNGSLRLAVTDAAPLPDGWQGFPVAGDHGLGLVAALANDWAVRPLPGGKVIWADLAREDG